MSGDMAMILYVIKDAFDLRRESICNDMVKTEHVPRSDAWRLAHGVAAAELKAGLITLMENAR